MSQGSYIQTVFLSDKWSNIICLIPFITRSTSHPNTRLSSWSDLYWQRLWRIHLYYIGLWRWDTISLLLTLLKQFKDIASGSFIAINYVKCFLLWSEVQVKMIGGETHRPKKVAVLFSSDTSLLFLCYTWWFQAAHIHQNVPTESLCSRQMCSGSQCHKTAAFLEDECTSRHHQGVGLYTENRCGSVDMHHARYSALSPDKEKLDHIQWFATATGKNKENSHQALSNSKCRCVCGLNQAAV